MKKEPFIKIVPVKALKKESVKRLIAAYLIVFWILPFIKFIPIGGGRSAENWYLLILAPVALLGCGGILSMKYGFYPLYPASVLIGAMPSEIVFDFQPSWQYALSYALIALTGNLLAELLRTSSKEKKKKKDK